MNPKFHIEQVVPIQGLGANKGVIKGIRITGDEGETVYSPWEYKLQYHIWTLEVDRLSMNSWNRQHPEELTTPEDWKTWSEWGWVSEEDILKAQEEFCNAVT